MPTSGRPIPARSAWASTVCTSQRSVALRGVAITWTPIAALAIVLDMKSEISDPAKPSTAAKIKSAVRFRSTPFAASRLSMPKRRKATDSTARMAKLAAR